MAKNKSKKSASKSDYRRTSIGNLTTPKMTKDTASFIEKLAEKDSKRKKKKESKKTEDIIGCHLAKKGLIDKDKVKAARKSSSKKKKKKGSSSSSSSYSDCSDLLYYRLLQRLGRLGLLERWQEEEIEEREVSQRRHQ